MRRPLCYLRRMPFRHVEPMLALVLAASIAAAGRIPVPAVAESLHCDTGTVTNAPVLPALVQHARTFTIDIALDATSSSSKDNDPWLFIAR